MKTDREVLKSIASMFIEIETSELTHAELVIANMLSEIGILAKATNEHGETFFKWA